MHISGQLEVFEGVEGDVSVVHHSKDHWDVSTLEGQQLESSQVRHRAVEAAHTHAGVRFPRVALLEVSHRVRLVNIETNPPLIGPL